MFCHLWDEVDDPLSHEKPIAVREVSLLVWSKFGSNGLRWQCPITLGEIGSRHDLGNGPDPGPSAPLRRRSC